MHSGRIIFTVWGELQYLEIGMLQSGWKDGAPCMVEKALIRHAVETASWLKVLHSCIYSLSLFVSSYIYMYSSSNFPRNQLALLRVVNNILVYVVHEFCRHSYLFWCINEYCMYSEHSVLFGDALFFFMPVTWCVCVCMGAKNFPVDPNERKLTCYAHGNSNPEYLT